MIIMDIPYALAKARQALNKFLVLKDQLELVFPGQAAQLLQQLGGMNETELRQNVAELEAEQQMAQA